MAEYLKQFVDKNATFSYNTSIHEETKCTLYELVFGKLARQPSSEPLLAHEKLEAYGDYLINLITKLHDIQSFARKNLINAKIKSKNYYD